MRSAVRISVVLWISVLICWGCAGSRDALKNIPTAINQVNPAKGLNKKIALALTQTPPSALGRKVGDLYFKSLVDAIRDDGPHLQLVTRQDTQWPENMTEMIQAAASSGHFLDLAEKVRLTGFNAWACARIEKIWPVARKTGILWFRKDKYFIYVELSFAVYDPFTGAKILDDVVETSAKVSEDDYNAFKSAGAVEIESLNETIVDIASDLGEHAAKVINDQPWQTSVVGVEGGRILLSAGTQSGLQAGDRLAVFEGRRTMDGQNGERFIVPGTKVGDLEVVRVAEQVSEAKEQAASGGSKIQAGDIAVAVK